MNVKRSIKRVVILGAGGREYHVFNIFFRDKPMYDVVAFTAAQIPFLSGKKYPKVLAEAYYPDGIPIVDESELGNINADIAVLAYSDISHKEVMDKASQIIASGMSLWLMGPKETMLESKVPVISICAVRTGCGKSNTTRKVMHILKDIGRTPVVIRHPMAYGDLKRKVVQRFTSMEDIDKAKCTIEEREEYEPLVNRGFVVYAGVDYEKILRAAEKEADVIVWDGGNNDFSFIKPDFEIVVTDVHRFEHGFSYYPGAVNLRRADVVIINKVSAPMRELAKRVRDINKKAEIIFTKSIVSPLPNLKNKTMICVEDGPTITHGGMTYGAAYESTRLAGHKIIEIEHYYLKGSIKEAVENYPKIKCIPALGYSSEQIKDLEETLNAAPVDAVVYATPVDLTKIIKVNKPMYRVNYEIEEIGSNLKLILSREVEKW